jgi:hypothetical protein
MVLTVFAGISEFERELIHYRTSSGRITAKAQGVRFGRPPKLEARAALAAYHPVEVCPVALGQRAAFAHALVSGEAVTEFDPAGRAATELLDLYRFTEGQLWRDAPR